MKKNPGPVGTSCLTCRRRRKKCGRQRPACERCVAGEFECLGYDDPSEHIAVPALAESNRLRELPLDLSASGTSQSTFILPVSAASDDASTPSIFESPPVLQPESDESDYSPGSTSAYGFDGLPSILHLETHNTPASTSGQDSIAHRNTQPQTLGSSVASDYVAALVLPATSVSCASREPRIRPRRLTQTTTALPHSRHSLNKQISSYMFSLPRSLSPVPPHVKKMVDFVVAQYDRLFSYCYFGMVPEAAAKFRGSIAQRVVNSSTTRCIMFLGAKIIDSSLDGTLSKKYNHYSQWIERFEHGLWSRTRNLAYDEDQTQLVDTLELALLKLRVVDRIDLYQLLQNLTPIFLQVVFSDSTLWPSEYHSTSVSLAHILASNRNELHCFILMDMLCSMIYGLPQLIEYDTSVPVFSTDKHSLHVIPAELQIILVEINIRCFQMSVAHDWNDIEQRLLSWQSPTPVTVDEDSWKTIAQLAVHESWRQTLLIYLYMAACGVSSDDPRVQSSVRQVFQIISSAKNSPLPTDHHFFLQYVIAGACVRSEKQRALAREQLMGFLQDRSWFWRGSDLVLVLDHLWHGAAANGRPIRWSDYISSHQSVLSPVM
ncbi:hypothetical protein BDV93DRAFT_604790 [Ceratobasidium sp. AG-I]|nr:hypothetical protein BDV93DRAFT_604790 [Ceratobasidium sp. AG-I]